MDPSHSAPDDPASGGPLGREAEDDPSGLQPVASDQAVPHLRALPPLRLALRPSRQLLLALAAAHLAAGVAATIAVPHAAACTIVLAVLVASGIHSVRHHALRNTRRSVLGLQLSGERDCRLHFAGEDSILCKLKDSSYVSTGLVVLQLREQGRLRPHHVVLLPDSLEADGFRRLRARLRWTQPGTQEQADSRASL